MGVTGLWTVVQPCARPIKLETLNKRRLAVDASIWIYQFLKAVRDKEGNALRNSHVVGFFRRICKLLYFGIKPVFVFDGGAPVMKRQTIAGRKKRREGHREDAVKTAGKLLAVQMQRSAEEEEARRRNANSRLEEEEVPDVPVYADEALMTDKEKQQSRKFKKKDAYHLPNLDVSLQDMGAPNDPRIMSQEELEEYARHFHQGQDINLYDFSKIDFDSSFFLSLPATDRYNILNAARLRSRLRMGYSKEQLDTMFPDRMAFSKFQIYRVAERNDLTQRLMNINGMNGEDAFHNSGQRIAGERGREYVLVKDSEHEGGWVLGVVGNKEGEEERPIDLDRPEVISEDDEVSDEDVFEDVPIEGLNRLPKLSFLRDGVFDQSLQLQEDENFEMRRALQESRQSLQHHSASQRKTVVDDDSLFVEAEGNIGAQQQNNDTDGFFDGEDEDLERALALSLQPDQADEEIPDIHINKPLEPPPFHQSMPDPDSESDDGMDFAAAVARTKVSKKPSQGTNAFGGPLPFESITLSKASDKKRKDGEIDENAGGFLKEPSPKKQQSDPLPPWFVGERSNAEFIADPAPCPDVDDQSAAPDHQFLFNRRSPDIIDVDELSETAEAVDIENEDREESEKNRYETKVSETEDVSLEQPPRVEEIEKVYNEITHHVDEKPTDIPSQGDLTPHETLPEASRKPQEQQVVVFKSQSPRSAKSASPEFEDVVLEPPLQGPEITVVSHQEKAQPQARLFEEVQQPEAFMQDQADYSDPEDEDLFKQLAAEGEEHARFASTLNSAVPNQEVFDYEQELKQLRNQQKNERRDADEVTTIMINECQQLLTLFGLPYITAPMEAEAQCAKLVSLGLVDGIVTDDSDIFLFGGTRVYKNMFNQSKFVECYLTSDLEKEYALHRQKLISFAHLLGSDYTEGIPGIGPVTALEILTEFGSLEEFREWWAQLQMGANNPDDVHLAFRKKFRKKASKIFLPSSFPDTRVDEAYLEPEVDNDPSQFQWGVPDLNGLRNFLMATIGWSQERTDEVLVPVIRDMNRRGQEGTQSNITQFMQGPQGAGAFAPRARGGGPSRMEQAFNRLREEAQTGESSAGNDEHESNDAGEEASGSRKKTKRTASTKVKAGTSKKRKTRRANSQDA